MNDKFSKFVGAAVFVLGIVFLAGLLFSVPLYYLWNGCLVGLVDGIKPLNSIWHALGISILCALLFQPSPSK